MDRFDFTEPVRTGYQGRMRSTDKSTLAALLAIALTEISVSLLRRLNFSGQSARGCLELRGSSKERERDIRARISDGNQNALDP